jgi:histidyl-tRNA synthetase
MIAQETYTFEDRGGRSVTLRPEMTPTVARMVAHKKRELGYPLRWYSIPNLFRYDRPQRGRYREHWQLNVDLFGVGDDAAEEEVIVLADQVFKSYGARDGMYSIRINDRNTMRAAIEPALKDSSRFLDAVRLIDKKEKLPKVEFEQQWSALASVPFDECVTEDARLTALIERLHARGVTAAVFDPTIARGFDYYTGMVFEITDTHPDNASSLAGGGRYDTLVELYGSESVPVVGFGMGVERVQLFLETHGLLPQLKPATQLYLVPMDSRAQSAAQALRDQGIHVALGMKHEKIADHIRNADKLGIPYFAVFGEHEAASGEIEIKQLVTGELTRVSIEKAHTVLLGT